MLSYIILIISISILVILSFYIFKKDIFSPTFLSCVFFDVCASCAFLGLWSWNNISSISIQLIIIINLGLISFGLGEFCIKKILKHKEKYQEDTPKEKYINVSKIKYICTIIFIIFTSIILLKELKEVSLYYGYSGNSLPEMLNYYRMNTALYSNNMNISKVDISFIVKQMQKACEIICVFYIYIFSTNIFIKREKKLFLLLIPILLCMGQSLLTTGRVMLMRFFITFLFFIIYNYIKNNRDDRWIRAKILGICTSGIVIMVAVFYLMIPLLGREKNNTPIEYITFYFGTAIPSFEYAIENQIEEKDYLGRETFSGIYDSLDKLNIIKKSSYNDNIWIDFLGYRSNVYTSFKAYYADFGIMGIIVCQFAFGFVFTLIYMLAKKNKCILIWYAFYVYILIEQIRAEQFFRLISLNTLAYTFFILIFYEFFFDFWYTKKFLKMRRTNNEK